MATVKLSPLFNDQTITSTGAPAVGYKLYTYAAGSSSLLATYTDSSGSTPQANPIIMNANGFPANPIWLQVGLSYKFILKDSNDVQVGSPFDNITGVNDSSSSTSQWQASNVAPTYISSTSFSVPGDQTTDFHVGRRLQFTVSAGTVYGTISTSSFAGGISTMTLTMDSGQALDSGLSVVNLSILRSDRLAIPGNISGTSLVKGLSGNVNATTPLTKFDLSAHAVVLRSASGESITRYNTGTLTCDLGLAGSAANGRDQSGAFTAGSWIYLYFIWNGTTLATLASTTAPSSFTGSTLPSGYTHWAFAAAIRWNGSSNILPVIARGSQIDYDIATAGANRVVAGGTASSMTTVSASTLVPPNGLRARLMVFLSTTTSSAGTPTALLRTTGSSQSGIIVCRTFGTAADAVNIFDFMLNSSQQFDYMLTASGLTGGGVSIDVLGYAVPNGDA